MFTDKKKKPTLKELFTDMFYPFIFLYTFLKQFLTNIFPYYTSHKEVVVIVSYGLGLMFQAIILLSIFGYEGLNYLSIKFSLILFIIFLFLSSVSIFVVLFYVGAFLLLLSPYFAILFGFLYFVLVFVKWLKPELLEKLFKKIPDSKKMDKLYYINIGVMIVSMALSFYVSYMSAKPVIMDTKSDKQVIGKLLFSNQDYYFMDMCGTHKIFPSSEVNSIAYPCVNGVCTPEKSIELNKKYELFCSKLSK